MADRQDLISKARCRAEETEPGAHARDLDAHQQRHFRLEDVDRRMPAVTPKAVGSLSEEFGQGVAAGRIRNCPSPP